MITSPNDKWIYVSKSSKRILKDADICNGDKD